MRIAAPNSAISGAIANQSTGGCAISAAAITSAVPCSGAAMRGAGTVGAL